MPVAANHGAAKIMKMNDIRTSLFGVTHAPSDSTTPQACSMVPLKMLREGCYSASPRNALARGADRNARRIRESPGRGPGFPIRDCSPVIVFARNLDCQRNGEAWQEGGDKMAVGS
jgi:hypothetical protein